MRIASRETKFSPAVRRQSVQQVQERRMTGLEWGYRSRFDELSRAQRIVIGRDRWKVQACWPGMPLIQLPVQAVFFQSFT